MAKGVLKEETKVADLLLLLRSCSRKVAAAPESTKKAAAVAGGGGGAFECKTCSRRFPTFQALGGHRTSHGRGGHEPGGQRAPKKPKMLRQQQQQHKCSVCGVAFRMGQALGGHMRRHKLAEAAGSRTAMRKDVPWLDLNLPPLDIDLRL